jgi:hypothetical protein
MTHVLEFFLEFFLDLWATAWRADERLHGPSRARWPWVVGGVAVVFLIGVYCFGESIFH